MKLKRISVARTVSEDPIRTEVERDTFESCWRRLSRADSAFAFVCSTVHVPLQRNVAIAVTEMTIAILLGKRAAGRRLIRILHS